jgi:enamine deaminase RidA (YjgF/YER057c/UK114 family)
LNARISVWPSDVCAAVHASPAVKAGGWVFVSGDTADAATSDGVGAFLGDALEAGARSALGTAALILEAAGCDLRRDVVRSYQWLPSARPTYEEFMRGSSTTDVRMDPYNRVFTALIDEPRPASTAMGVRRLPGPGARVAVDLIAMEPDARARREGFELPPGVPRPVVRYSPALRSVDWIFLAGDLATDFRGDFLSDRHLGEPSGLAPEARVNPYFWYGSPIEIQTEYTLRKLERIAEAAGTSLDRCVKAEVYTGHPQDLHGIDRVWRRWFPENPPARVVVPYMGLAARGCRIEIALTLLASEATVARETVETSEAPEPFLHEPQAVKAGSFLFFSTQLAVDSQGRLAAETKRYPSFPYYGQPPKLQVRYMLKNVAAICEAAGTSLENICRRQAFHDDFTWFAPAIEEWHAHFPTDPPASTTLEVGGPLIVPGAHLLLDLVAYVPD